MTDTHHHPPPVFTAAPSGPQCRLLRRLAAGSVLTAVRTGCRRVLCLADGHEVDARAVAGLLTRGLIEERETGDDDRSEYVITATGRGWVDGEVKA